MLARVYLIVWKWEAVSLSDFIRSSVSILQQRASCLSNERGGDILYLLAYSFKKNTKWDVLQTHSPSLGK